MDKINETSSFCTYLSFDPTEDVRSAINRYDSLIKDGGHLAILFNKDQTNLIEDLKKNIPKDLYFCQLGFWNNKRLRTEEFKSELISIERFNDQEDFVNFSIKTLESYFNDEWKGYIPEKILNSNYYYFKNIFTVDKSLTLKNKSEIVAHFCCFDSENCLGEKVNQLGWAWISPQVSKDIKFEIKNHFMIFLNKFANKNKQAGVHLYNGKSIGFLKKLGFEFKCIHILKK